MPTKVIRAFFGNDEYQIFLDDSDRIDQIIRFQHRKHIGDIITWAELPWQLREQYEQHIDPNV